ncbi:MAG: class I SAM-dependent methyltransferase [Acidimicrobiales bacterium]
MSFDGEEYQARFDALAASGTDVHGEASLVASLVKPGGSVLDAGCGSGRVAIELARRGYEVVGADVDASMLAAARQRAPAIEWIAANLAELGLDRRFAAVLMAGNVVLFTPPGTQAAVVAGCARHVRPGGLLVVGFQLGRGYDLADYDAACTAVGLEPVDRWSTWARAPFHPDDTYAVTVHRAPISTHSNSTHSNSTQ